MSRKISQHKELEASRLLLSEQDTADRWLTASVCFITDAGNCGGEDFGGANTPDGSSGGSSGGDDPEWEVDNEEKCKKEGYTNENCGETATPGTPCLYDSSYHTGCICKPEYNKTCSGADEAGKGASCNGKYKECCSLCSAYPYSDGRIPTGHITTASCQSCTGTKYQTRCNTNSSNTGTYISCGSATGSGQICTDDSGTYYEKCTCPTNYEFNAQTKSCVCKTNFKYACTGTGYAGGQGESCDNKYQTCACATGYSWSASSGCVKCSSSFKYTCTGANEVKPSGNNCGGLYTSCNCKSGYEWSNGKCLNFITNCEIGDLYYSDDTCSNKLLSSKTLLGIVIYNNGTTGWAITKEPIKTGVGWDSQTNYYVGTSTSLNTSCTNTAKLVSLGNRFTAANVANSYRPSGTPSNKKWCLPSKDLLQNINNQTNYTKVNNGIQTAGGKKLGTGIPGFSYERFWSSSDYNTAHVWEYAVYSTNNFEVGWFNKSNENDDDSVRPVICFGTNTSSCQN